MDCPNNCKLVNVGSKKFCQPKQNLEYSSSNPYFSRFGNGQVQKQNLEKLMTGFYKMVKEQTE